MADLDISTLEHLFSYMEDKRLDIRCDDDPEIDLYGYAVCAGMNVVSSGPTIMSALEEFFDLLEKND